MSTVKKQSDFSRLKYNEAKMGAYYTDVGHCRMLSEFFDFPEEEEVCCLEPSIGNAAAVLAVTGKEKGGRNNLKIFGVELNEGTYDEVSQNPAVDYCLQADFLTDVVVTNQAFSFCFANPPYGAQEDGMRYELAFLQKLEPYLATGAVMVFVIPIYVANTMALAVEWCSNFTTRHVFRFQDKEFQKYQQVVLIGEKKKKEEKDVEAADALLDALKDPDAVPLLPEKYDGEKIPVGKSTESGVTEFMPMEFRQEDARKYLGRSPLQGLVQERLAVPPYLIDNLGRPPIMPSEGHMYLLAVSGAGQGLVGSEENHDLHLQRGVTKIVKKCEYVQDEDGAMKLVETSYPQVSYNLIEADGNIYSLQ